MSKKTAEVIDITIEDLALSLVGWQPEEAQARLVTTAESKTCYNQQIAFSGTFRFLPEDWSDRFGSSDYAPEVYLAVNRRDSPAPAYSYNWVVLETIKSAQKGLVRVSAHSESWTSRTPMTADNIDLRLTAYDLSDVSNVYLNSKLELPSTSTTSLEITAVDETSSNSPRAQIAVSSAHLAVGEYRTELTVHAEGTFAFGSADDLLKAYLDRDDDDEWDGYGDPPTVENSAPFTTDVPEIRIEILDDTGFLLEDRRCRFYGHIEVDDQGNIPRRQPRWIAHTVIRADDLPGDPNRVVVRVIDGD